MKKIKQSISICLILMLLSAFAMTVVADANPITPIDTAKEATLTVQFHTTNNQPIENAVFKLWKVGEVTKAGAFRINEPYLSVYNPEDEWKNVVLHMLQKAEQENIEPLLTATTDSNGVAAFQSTDDVKLRAGLYIVDGALKRGNQYAFKATPFIVRLPNFVGENHDGVNDDEDVWNYDVIAVPKEYTVSLYTVYYNDNRQSIGNREVTQMPQPSFEQFDIGNSRLFTAPHSSDPLEPYVRRSGAGDTDKNRCRLLYAEPQAEGYEFVYWVESLTYQNAWQYVSGITENLILHALWKVKREGSFGGNVTWKADGEFLTVEGTGNMDANDVLHFDELPVDVRYSMRFLTISEGVTSIEKNVFMNSPLLESAVIAA